MPKITRFNGKNNTDSPEDMAVGDMTVAEACLISDDGVLESRPGISPIVEEYIHPGLGRYRESLFYGKGGSLWKHDIGGGNSEVIADVFGVGDKLHFYATGQYLFASSASQAVRVDNWSGVSAKVGIPVPAEVSVVSTPGTLPNGKYFVTSTVMDPYGEESGASYPAEFTVTEGGMIVQGVSSGTGPGWSGCVYVSGPNGEILPNGAGMRQAGTVAYGFSDIEITSPPQGKPCTTLGMEPFPGGRFITFYRGRMYAAIDNFIFFSEKLIYGGIRYQTGTMIFDSEVSMIIPVENGLWVGTLNDFFFLSGTDPHTDGGFQIKSKTPYFAVGGVASHTRELALKNAFQGVAAVFMTRNGVYAGDGNGSAFPLTAEKWTCPYEPTGADAACAGVWQRKGRAQYVFAADGYGFNMNLANHAVTEDVVSVPCGIESSPDGATMFSIQGGGADGIYQTTVDTWFSPHAVCAAVDLTSGREAILNDVRLSIKGANTLAVHIYTKNSAAPPQGAALLTVPSSSAYTTCKVEGIGRVKGTRWGIEFSSGATEDLGVSIREVDLDLIISRTRKGMQNRE